MPSSKPPKDDSIIDITGLSERLTLAAEEPVAKANLFTKISANFYRYETPNLGKMYGEKLGLTTRQTGWLNKFDMPTDAFMGIEAARQATVLLYVTALLAVERQLKMKGTTLVKEIEFLEIKAKNLRYYSRSWYSSASAGHKPGADIYLAAFRQCQNAVRAHFDAGREIALFGKSLAELEPIYQLRIGFAVAELLPAMIAQVPPPDATTELALNAQIPNRWKSGFEKLLPLLAPDPARFVQAVEKLGRQNELNPRGGNLYFEAAKLLVKPDREGALRCYLRYAAHELAYDDARIKPWLKTALKVLFPLPEQQARFEAIMHELEAYQKLEDALAQLPKVYAVKRKKIELDKTAIHAVRNQHTGTVELLNEYLRDEAAAPTTPTKLPKAATPAKAAKPRKSAQKIPKSLVAAAPAATGSFASGLGLSTSQQALLQLFANQQLVLTQAKVEALAKSHGTLRNQLIDGLNDTCYELLDDVLVEETADGYTIYEPYFQKITG